MALLIFALVASFVVCALFLAEIGLFALVGIPFT